MARTSPPGQRPGRRSSSTSRSSTTTSGGTPRWGTSPRRSTNRKTVNPLSTFRGELHQAVASNSPGLQRREVQRGAGGNRSVVGGHVAPLVHGGEAGQT